jgi:bifunctional UDP-N-acetylglucosamine pyrophosphorylase/glucosamine-1-phosphate N-acetyltransferase
VVGVQADKVKVALEEARVRLALQKEQKGTAHAVRAALPTLKGFAGDVLVLYGDSTLLRTETLKELVRTHRGKKADMTLITADLADPFGYGRIIRDGRGAIRGIVEQKDCTPEQRAIHEFNPGIYCYRSDFLKAALPRVKNHNRQKEYYLTDLVEIAVKAGKRVASLKIADVSELMGINSRWELALVAAELRARINRAHCLAGVTIEDPATTWIGPEVTIGKDAVIEPGARLSGRTQIGAGCVIEMNARIEDSRIRKGARIKAGSVLEECEVGEGTQVGPMAHLRPGSVIGRDVRIGNFVETKKALIADGAKLSHLTYAGDAEIGKNVNIGCGFITCNYDGVHKHKTVIEDDVFVGSDTQTVAPVRIGKGAYIGSGSTITRDIPPGALALTRAPLVIKEGWVKKRKAKKAAKK